MKTKPSSTLVLIVQDLLDDLKASFDTLSVVFLGLVPFFTSVFV